MATTFHGRLREELQGVATKYAANVYPMTLPAEAVMPAFTYQRISSVPVNDHSGMADLAFERWQIDAWSTNYSQAQAMADDIRIALSGWVGEAGPNQARGSHAIGAVDLYEPETKRFHVPVDVRIGRSLATA